MLVVSRCITVVSDILYTIFILIYTESEKHNMVNE